ncbi:MAG: tRNA uridine-5-carboxymethylaminomethyl(34) synthesis GTPase MnmE [Treponema sp.]|jgi:tRNA modification GTPase|nr:tRNA uridine-5-carboxymethylaminomethyl(34) synthesis GTPase MnmE [Treponema sp.]
MHDNYGDDSPIAAFATVAGNSALTLIRCSGKGAIDLASSVFAPKKLKDALGNTVLHGWIISANEKIDEVLVSVFRAPKSYTGEDSLDICCHGGPSAGKAVMSVLKKAGFRDALPGEFTFRAFTNGKLDLTKAESVMELVSAKTDTSRRHAVSRLCGSLETEIGEIKKLLVHVLSGAEIYLDYSEDEISADADEAEGKLPNQDTALDALARLKRLSASWQIERIFQEGVTVVIAGRPNSGKSSLFNALLKEDRSIVTEIPGTTRDWIEAYVSVEGIPVRLIDTAGLRESSDSVEKIGVQRSRELLKEAELVLYLIDGAQGVTKEDTAFCVGYNAAEYNTAENAQTQKPLLLLWNKADIAPLPQNFEFADNKTVSVSAKTGEGIAELFTAIASAIQEQADYQLREMPAVAVGTERQKKLVDTACSALEEALALAEKEEPLDLIAPLLREAVNALGEITGEVSTADILEEMFSRFCVGK